VESTWESRDLPVLEAFVRRFEERGGAAGAIDGQQLADQLGMPPEQVTLAVEALRPSYVDTQVLSHPDGDAYILRGVTAEARRAVGQWRPSLVDQMPLLPEQRDLLAKLVEASRNAPAAQRQPFMFIEGLTESDVQHPGLPDSRLAAYAGDLDVLEREGLLNVSYPQRHMRRFDITPRGFQAYEELRRHAETPLRQVEEDLMRHLDSDAFQQSYQEASRKWSEAAEMLAGSDSEQQLTMVGHLCREAMQAFATALVGRYQPPGVDTDRTHDVARIRAVLGQHRPRLGKTTAPFLDALLAYWGTVSDLVQRQEHGAQKEGRPLVWEDGRRVVFQTVIVMFEVDRALTIERPST
jgi:hypothetical protein